MSRRGSLRVYLGCAPGVGKTFAMLDEGERRRSRGTDVVVAIVETHGRPRTAEKVEGLEVVPRRPVDHRGTTFFEMDLQAVLDRRPDVALVDELAHSNIPGSGPNAKRWQDVDVLLDAGIDVITTVNVQHLESLNDVVEAITGVPQRETVPDVFVRSAEQVELVDQTAEALRRRMAHGNIYAPDKIDAALDNYFRVGNLTALRELALLWLADAVDDGLQRYREQHGIQETWETRERVVVALTGGPEGETLLRRAARIAARGNGGELLAVHVARSDGLSGVVPRELVIQRELTEQLEGTFHTVVGDDVARTLLQFAQGVNATQIVLGASRRKPWIRVLTGEGTGSSVIRLSGAIDVHMVSHDYAAAGGSVLTSLPISGSLTRERRLAGLGAAAILFAILTPSLAAVRDDVGLGSDLLLYLMVVIIASLIGGIWPALTAALAGTLLINWFFLPPIHTLTISDPENLIALGAFVVTAALVSRVVDLAARRATQAHRLGVEAQTLSFLASRVIVGDHRLPSLMAGVRETFGATSVSLLRRITGDEWEQCAASGPQPPTRLSDADAQVPVSPELALALNGIALRPEDERVLMAFAAQVALAFEQEQLTAAAQAMAPLEETDRQRTALLNAVSHDLRTPLAAAKAAVSSLRSPDVRWTPDQTASWLAEADIALDRLTDLVTSLLDLSRLQAGAMPVLAQPVGLEDAVSAALDHVARDRIVEVDVPSDLPLVLADAGLLQRVIANLVQNALRHSKDVRVAASHHAGIVELRVVDRGPGIPEQLRESVFAAFQRYDDVPVDGAGVGLGLAVARGLTEAMGGSVRADETPGGGATLVVSLDVAPS